MPGKYQIVYIGRVADVEENTLVVLRSSHHRVAISLVESWSNWHRVHRVAIESRSQWSSRDRVAIELWSSHERVEVEMIGLRSCCHLPDRNNIDLHRRIWAHFNKFGHFLAITTRSIFFIGRIDRPGRSMIESLSDSSINDSSPLESTQMDNLNGSNPPSQDTGGGDSSANGAFPDTTQK